MVCKAGNEGEQLDYSKIEKFIQFIEFFQQEFSSKDFLGDAEVNDDVKIYVKEYYKKIFRTQGCTISSRHLKWYRRIQPIFLLDPGSTIVDYGGGYGLDSIFLASLGYKVILFEKTNSHLIIAKCLAKRFIDSAKPISLSFVLSGHDSLPKNIDGMVVKEVAHHIEPAQQVFIDADFMLKNGGKLFLLEPNYYCPYVQFFFFKVRGFNLTSWIRDQETGRLYVLGNENIRPTIIWNRYAKKAGFKVFNTIFVVYGINTCDKGLFVGFIKVLEKSYVLKNIFSTHITHVYTNTKPHGL